MYIYVYVCLWVWLYVCVCEVCVCMLHMVFSCAFDVAASCPLCSKHRVLQECWWQSNDFIGADERMWRRGKGWNRERERERQSEAGSGRSRTPRTEPGHPALVPLEIFILLMSPALLGSSWFFFKSQGNRAACAFHVRLSVSTFWVGLILSAGRTDMPKEAPPEKLPPLIQATKSVCSLRVLGGDGRPHKRVWTCLTWSLRRGRPLATDSSRNPPVLIQSSCKRAWCQTSEMFPLHLVFTVSEVLVFLSN